MARPTIAELEAILRNEEEVPIEILPNGEVRAKGKTSPQEIGARKPLTMREDLGGKKAKSAVVEDVARLAPDGQGDEAADFVNRTLTVHDQRAPEPGLEEPQP